MLRKTPLFLVLCLIIAVFSFLITTSGGNNNPNTIIEIAAAPSFAYATINGHAAKIGKNSVDSAGTYSVTASANGFASQTQAVNVSLGQSSYVGFSLVSNTPGTKNWYLNNPSEQSLSDAIGSHESDLSSSKSQADNPFLSKLPVTYGDGNGGTVKISQGVPLTPNGPPGVYVDAASPEARQGALAYMRNRGYDPAVMDIVFQGQVNYLGLSRE